METATPNFAKPKSLRRWFSFSLRTLLIFVTLTGCGMGWLGWQFEIVKERKAMRSEMKRRRTVSITLIDRRPDNVLGLPVGEVSFIRRWMGDEPLDEVAFPIQEMRSPYADRVRDLFPEATIGEMELDGKTISTSSPNL
jgi:hypothetical protein